MLKDDLSVLLIRSIATGAYRNLDVKSIVKGLLPSWDGLWKTETVDDRVMFNAAGNACIILDLLNSNVQQVILLEINVQNAAGTRFHVLSTEDPYRNLTGWVFYYFRFEFKDTNNALYNGYPLIWYTVRGVQKLCRYVNNGYQSSVMPYGNNLLLTVEHSGRGNSSQTVKDKTFVCYAKMVGNYIDAFVTDNPGTWSGETFVGTIDTKTDNHNGPAMTVDSKGFFHMVCASHLKEFKYWKSGAPYNVTVWQAPKVFEGKYTYAAIICDKTDRIYMAFRADGYNFHMVIKDGLDRWYTKIILIRVTRGMDPAKIRNYFYIRYNHILNLDSNDNVYMSIKPHSAGYYPIKRLGPLDERVHRCVKFGHGPHLADTKFPNLQQTLLVPAPITQSQAKVSSPCQATEVACPGPEMPRCDRVRPRLQSILKLLDADVASRPEPCFGMPKRQIRAHQLIVHAPVVFRLPPRLKALDIVENGIPKKLLWIGLERDMELVVTAISIVDNMVQQGRIGIRVRRV
ncbi:hypothetical protein HK102_006460 [Quaeritorhiza haematococci]|nr:hypothetical protein HK102_006460 [Quaeritorhiza haematococci]